MLQLAESCDGTHFSTLFGMNGLGETSAFGPDFISFETEAGPPDWLGWTGTDSFHHLNVLWTNRYPLWNGAKTVLPEAALGGPMLGFDDGLLIARTGLDPLHHLNVVRLTGF